MYKFKLMRINNGFTLLELLTVVAISGIVLSMGVPSFGRFVTNSRLSSETNLLIGSINLARSEAVKRNKRVIIRRDGNTAHKWEDGWSIFVDVEAQGVAGYQVFNDDGDGILCEADEDCIIKIFVPSSSKNTIRTENTKFKDFIEFESTGLRTWDYDDTVTFSICSEASNSENSRKLLINKMGRAKSSEDDASC